MDKLTYLAELAEGLARWVPERERQDILRYYAEYFEEAGPDRETQVVQELGDPWALSSRLAVEGGYVTQQQADSWTPPKRKKWPWILIGAAAVLVFVVAAVIQAAMGFGGWFGRHVASYVTKGIAVVEEDATAEAPLSSENVAFFEEDDPMYTGSGFSAAAEGFWTEEDGALAPFVSIDVDVGLANVTVTGGDDFTLSISSDAALGGYRLKWEVKDGTLKIRDDGEAAHVQINNWDDLKNAFGINADAMDVIITIPDRTVLSGLKAKTGLGNVFLSDLDVEKKLEAETGLGDVECYEVRAYDEVDLESGMGDVTLGVSEAYDGAEFDLNTGMGTVEAQVDGAERNWKYEAETGMGTVTVNGSGQGTKIERKGGGRYQLEAESGMGDVNLYFSE